MKHPDLHRGNKPENLASANNRKFVDFLEEIWMKKKWP